MHRPQRILTLSLLLTLLAVVVEFTLTSQETPLPEGSSETESGITTSPPPDSTQGGGVPAPPQDSSLGGSPSQDSTSQNPPSSPPTPPPTSTPAIPSDNAPLTPPLTAPISPPPAKTPETTQKETTPETTTKKATEKATEKTTGEATGKKTPPPSNAPVQSPPTPPQKRESISPKERVEERRPTKPRKVSQDIPQKVSKREVPVSPTPSQREREQKISETTSPAASLPLYYQILQSESKEGESGSTLGQEQSLREENTREKNAKKILESMDNQNVLGQLFMLGYSGGEVSQGLMNWIRNRSLGGVKVFGGSSKNLSQLQRTLNRYQVEAYQTQLGIPLLISTDQEGGLIKHVRGNLSDLPSAMALGKSGLYLDSYQSGVIISEELRALGINMNFAPNLDLYLDAKSSIVATRAFDSDPQEVAMYTLGFYRGLEKNRMISTAKHFPGHGRTALDSHGRLPVIDIGFNTLNQSDLLPYRLLIQEKVPAIMVGHLAFPEITGDRIPSSRSSFFLDTLLRKDWRYQGVVITDAMNMVAARSGTSSMAEASYQSILSGSDILLFYAPTPSIDRVWTYLLNKMHQNPVFNRRVRESAKRILKLKMDYLVAPEDSQVPQTLPDFANQESQHKIRNLIYHSLTVREEIPFKTINERPLFFISPYGEVGRSKDLFFEKSRYYYISYNTSDRTILNQVVAQGKRAVREGYHVVVYVPHNHLYYVAERLAEFTQHLTVISTQKPTLVYRNTLMKQVLFLHTEDPISIHMTLGVLSGQIPSETLKKATPLLPLA